MNQGHIAESGATPQMSTKKGLAIFGVDGHKAVKSEMTQLHDQDVMRIVTSTELLPSQKCEALAYLIFLERKHCGKIKGRGCADERKQYNKISKHESTSPTVSTESIFLSAVIDAHDQCVVKVVDVPGAFMHADMDDLVHVCFTGDMVDKLL